MALSISKCNHLTPLSFKWLNEKLSCHGQTAWRPTRRREFHFPVVHRKCINSR